MGRPSIEVLLNMKLTVAYITAREKPCLEWFIQSLRPQVLKGDEIDIIIVDAKLARRPKYERLFAMAIHPEYATVRCAAVLPKPTIWQGKHRITKEDWWAASNARNTALCLCQTDWIAFLDDRCVLMPTWLDSIRMAMKLGYAVCGSYQKRTGMTVENGVIKHAGIVSGEDSREKEYEKESKQFKFSGPCKCPGQWMFGCNFALPLEWALAVGGQAEIADSLSMEDVLFGLTLENSGYPICYDPKCKMIEDRTLSEIGPVMKRSDFGVSPNDKSHALLDMFRQSKTSMNTFYIRQLRQDVLGGKPWPIPTGPEFDWYDGQPIREM